MNLEEKEILEFNELTIKFLSGNCTIQERDTLEQLMQQDSSYQKLFNEVKRIWISAASWQSTTDVESTNLSWQKVKYRICPVQKKSSKSLFLSIPLSRWASVAAVLLLMFTSAITTWYFAQKKIRIAQNVICEISTPLGSRSHTRLPDGSEVWLNAGSKLQYPSIYKSGTRDVYLSGEGYFKVKSDKHHPFVVHCSEVKIKAVGTEFNVKAYPDENKIETTLIKGLVHVEGKDKNKKDFVISLSPKQKITLLANGELSDSLSLSGSLSDKTKKLSRKENSYVSAIPVNLTKTDLYTSWKDGRWFFEGIEIGDMAIILERQYNVSFVFNSEELKHYTFTGTFKQETLEQVMEVLKITAPLRYEMELGKVKLSLDEAISQKYKKYMNIKIPKNKPNKP